MQICRYQRFNSKQTAASLGDVHTNWRTRMLAKWGKLGFQAFVQTPLRARSHLWNSHLDACPDSWACKIEVKGLGAVIQTQLQSLDILVLFLVNTDKAVLHSESVEGSTCLKMQSRSQGAEGSFMVSKLFFPHPWLSHWHSSACAACFSHHRGPLTASAGLSWTFALKMPLSTHCTQVWAQKSLGSGQETAVKWLGHKWNGCRAIPASAGQKSSSQCSEFSWEN